jgi:hypothetical protein
LKVELNRIPCPFTPAQLEKIQHRLDRLIFSFGAARSLPEKEKQVADGIAFMRRMHGDVGKILSSLTPVSASPSVGPDASRPEEVGESLSEKFRRWFQSAEDWANGKR